MLDEDPDFYSNLAAKKYSFNGHGWRKSCNCIYLISCKHVGCQMKYIGFTTTPLNKRLSGHRANIVNGTEGIVMLQHFTRVHSVTNMKIKPINRILRWQISPCKRKILDAGIKLHISLWIK